MKFAALSLALGLAAGHAGAGTCTNLTNWLQPPHDTQHIVSVDAPLPEATGPATCGSSQSMSGGRSSHCAWPFEYRAKAAMEYFEDVSQLLDHCLGKAQDPAQAGTDVNHPDSYVLRQYKTPEGTVFVSLKDKGGLSQTLIFLRYEPDS